MTFNLIETLDDLSFLSNELLHRKYIAIDTEFRRTSKDNMKLALLQVNDGDEIYIIDSVKIASPEDSCRFLFSNSVLKIVHSCKEDLEAIYSWTGKVPRNIFDTQMAHAVLGGDYSVSYQDLIHESLEITIDKGETRSNWLRRPLTDAQLSYAASDVEFLIYIYQEQNEKLCKENKMQWLFEDIKLMIANTFNPIDNLFNTPSSLSKSEEKQVLDQFNTIIQQIAESHEINKTLFFSKRLQKDFIRILFSLGIEAALNGLSNWRHKLLYKEVKSLYSNFK